MLSKLSAIICYPLKQKEKEKEKEKEKPEEYTRRSPNKKETSLGIPGWWIVENSLDGIIYISDTGKKFKTIREVYRWRTEGPFEDVDWNIPSF